MQTPQVRIRPASARDCDTVFAWRNDPFIVAWSSSRRTVGLHEHRQWFLQSLRDPTRALYVVLFGRHKIGLVRFDRQGAGDCVISAYLLRAWTGKGRGTAAIRLAMENMLGQWPVARIVAHVRSNNHAALATFMKLDFTVEKTGGGCPAGHQELRYSRNLQGSP